MTMIITKSLKNKLLYGFGLLIILSVILCFASSARIPQPSEPNLEQADVFEILTFIVAIGSAILIGILAIFAPIFLVFKVLNTNIQFWQNVKVLDLDLYPKSESMKKKLEIFTSPSNSTENSNISQGYTEV